MYKYECDIYNILYDQALKSNMCKKYGCVILYRNKVIAAGFNRYKAKLYLGDNNNYEPNKYVVHAEKAAILKIKNKSILPKCKIYIGKISSNELTCAKPCAMCHNLIAKLKIRVA